MIYFIQPHGRPFVKIGYARCVRKRLSKIQVSHPDKVVLLGVLPGGRARETEVHALFAHLHVRGEWFRYTGEVHRFLEKEAEEYRPDVHDPAPEDVASQTAWKASLVTAAPGGTERGRRVCVWVQKFVGRANLMLQWHDTGKRKSRSAGTANPDEAERRRADLEALLNLGTFLQPVERNSSRNNGPRTQVDPATPVDASPSEETTPVTSRD